MNFIRLLVSIVIYFQRCKMRDITWTLSMSIRVAKKTRLLFSPDTWNVEIIQLRRSEFNTFRNSFVERAIEYGTMIANPFNAISIVVILHFTDVPRAEIIQFKYSIGSNISPSKHTSLMKTELSLLFLLNGGEVRLCFHTKIFP